MRDSKMVEKDKESLPVVFYALYFSAFFQVCSSSAPNQLHNSKEMQTQLPNRFESSIVFPVWGNVYPDGSFYADVEIGFPSKHYFLDIDTGSDLTWIQCAFPGPPNLLPAPHHPYNSNNKPIFIKCGDPICAFVQHPRDHPCLAVHDQCYYNVTYADSGLSLGMLIRDYFFLPLADKTYGTPLTFGCGYHQEHPSPAPYVDGVLGLGNGQTGIIAELCERGYTQNVIGHCLNGTGLGYIFFGYDLVPSSGIIWTQMLHNSLQYHYSLGPADLLAGQDLGAAGLELVIDSGSTYTYFKSEVYEATLALVIRELQGTPLVPVNDHSLPVCWSGPIPFQSIGQVRNYFSTFVLSFTNANDAHFELPPEAYLIVTSSGNVCLGILNSATEEGLGNLNIIGDISLQDKLVIYDNERQMIGWAPSRCDKLTKS